MTYILYMILCALSVTFLYDLFSNMYNRILHYLWENHQGKTVSYL